MSESPGLQAFCPRPRRWFTCKKFPPKKPPTATYKFRNRPPKGGIFTVYQQVTNSRETVIFAKWMWNPSRISEREQNFDTFWCLLPMMFSFHFPTPVPPNTQVPRNLPGANWNRDVATFLEAFYQWRSTGKAQTLDLESKLPEIAQPTMHNFPQTCHLMNWVTQFCLF